MISTIKQYPHAVILLSVLILLPAVVNAGVTYQPLVGIPGVDNAASNFDQYINQLYFVSISIAALLAVIKIIIGGVKWMLTDVVTQKSDAKNDIRGALLGLLLIIAAVLILGTINPQLTNLSVLQNAPGINQRNQSPGPGAGVVVSPGGSGQTRVEGSGTTVTTATPGRQAISQSLAQQRERECLPGSSLVYTTTITCDVEGDPYFGQDRCSRTNTVAAQGRSMSLWNQRTTEVTCVPNP
jgi:uncharacterized membrane protein